MAEREQGITIDVAYRYFTTDNRSFIVADTPGHEEYTRNMAVGASFADLAVILVDASKGVLVQTKRHTRICSLMGIKHIVYAINKMDLIDYDQNTFKDISRNIKKMTAEYEFSSMFIIPVSATVGDNITNVSSRMPWFKEGTLLKLVCSLNDREDVDGILVQLPLPPHINEDKVIQTISPEKDVDGFHPQSVGALSTGQPGFISCTPAGIIELLKRYNIQIDGRECVVIGRSNIVGKPVAMLLLRENGTVTVCHSHTADLKEVAKRADILIVAIGKAKFVTDEYIKDGAAVIDVGMDRDENGKLCGDVDFESVVSKAGAVTPVPGGVGPMTIAMLMCNCVYAAGLRRRV